MVWSDRTARWDAHDELVRNGGAVLHLPDQEGARNQAWHPIIPEVVESMIHVEEHPYRPPVRTIEDIERDDIVRQTLEAAAKMVESRNGNQTYQRAWTIAAQIIRKMKPF